jgi:predicted NAD/FAD-binding protein
MMPIEVDTIVPDHGLPADADIVVVGSGIIGVATAFFLAERA